jgi:hypothetical protein
MRLTIDRIVEVSVEPFDSKDLCSVEVVCNGRLSKKGLDSWERWEAMRLVKP